jgi:hypothetical protein
MFLTNSSSSINASLVYKNNRKRPTVVKLVVSGGVRSLLDVPNPIPIFYIAIVVAFGFKLCTALYKEFR